MKKHENREMLQTRTRQIMQSYQWGRFKELAHTLHEKGVGRAIGAVAREKPGEEDSLMLRTGGASLRYFHRLDACYREFLEWLDTVSEWPISPGIFDHVNAIIDLISYRKHERERGEMSEYFISRAERYENEKFKLFVYRYLGEELLDAVATLEKEDADEWAILLPAYCPEEFQDLPSADDSIKFFEEIAAIQGAIGRDNFLELLKEKIPQFAPEVHEVRMRKLEDALRILNALYEATVEYCKQAGYLE